MRRKPSEILCPVGLPPFSVKYFAVTPVNSEGGGVSREGLSRVSNLGEHRSKDPFVPQMP
jgi:hypothetical protein